MTPPVSGTLPGWAARLSSEFETADARAGALARGLTAEQLNWPPRPGAWSVGQCLEHLAVGNELYLAAIETALAGRTPDGAVNDLRIGAPSRWFIRRYVAPPSAHMKRAAAPGKIKPRTAVDAQVLDRFLRSNARTREIIRRAADYDVNRLRFRNPFAPVIRFTVGTGLEILSQHEQRHLLQAEKVAESPGFPGPPRAATGA